MKLTVGGSFDVKSSLSIVKGSKINLDERMRGR